MLFRRGFILFGVFWFVKAGCQNGMSVSSVFFLCPALLRSNLFSCVQDVTGNPQGLSDCLSVSLRDSRISGYFREGAEIRESRGGRFYFLSMSGCSLVDGGQGKLVGRNFNHFKSSTFQQVVDFIFEVADSPFGSWRAVKEILIEYGIEFRE